MSWLVKRKLNNDFEEKSCSIYHVFLQIVPDVQIVLIARLNEGCTLLLK